MDDQDCNVGRHVHIGAKREPPVIMRNFRLVEKILSPLDHV